MSDGIWNLFPFPTMTPTEVSTGSLVPCHPDCLNCHTKECVDDHKSPVGEVVTCRFGISYARLDDARVLNGVIVTDLDITTKRSQKRARRERERRVTRHQVANSIFNARKLGTQVLDDHELAKDAILRELDANPQLHQAVAEQLRKDFADNLNQSHDFLQLVKLVRGHAIDLLHERHPELTPEDAANKCPTEGAIFFSTSLMLVKMDSMVFLNEINRAHGRQVRFQIHPFILKYLRIYKWQAAQKDLEIDIIGQCFSSSYYNNDAIGAVIQGILDNLVKYAPARSKAAVIFKDEGDHVEVKFESLGPRIGPHELAKIFLPQYRAEAARKVELSGLGVGLATARQISDALDLALDVEQEPEPDPNFPERYRTTFSVRLNRVS